MTWFKLVIPLEVRKAERLKILKINYYLLHLFTVIDCKPQSYCFNVLQPGPRTTILNPIH